MPPFSGNHKDMLGYFGQPPTPGRTRLRASPAPKPPSDFCSVHGVPGHRCAVSKSDEEAQAVEAPRDASGSRRPTPFTLRK